MEPSSPSLVIKKSPPLPCKFLHGEDRIGGSLNLVGPTEIHGDSIYAEVTKDGVFQIWGDRTNPDATFSTKKLGETGSHRRYSFTAVTTGLDGDPDSETKETLEFHLNSFGRVDSPDPGTAAVKLTRELNGKPISEAKMWCKNGFVDRDEDFACIARKNDRLVETWLVKANKPFAPDGGPVNTTYHEKGTCGRLIVESHTRSPEDCLKPDGTYAPYRLFFDKKGSIIKSAYMIEESPLWTDHSADGKQSISAAEFSPAVVRAIREGRVPGVSLPLTEKEIEVRGGLSLPEYPTIAADSSAYQSYRTR